MDTVTEDTMAIALALQGGLGVIHCNNSIKEQCQLVAKVKRFCHGFISDPVTVGPCDTVGDVKNLARKLGFSGFPVVNNNVLMGLVGRHDLEATDVDSHQISGIMQQEMVKAQAGIGLQEAFGIIKETRVNRLPIVDENNQLVALVCRKDMTLQEKYPLATRDGQGRLMVGAAISTHPEDRERIKALISSGVDVLVIDSSQGHSSYQIETIRFIKDTYPSSTEVIAGNVVTKDQATALVEAGADALRIGMGSGTCCTTQDACGVGRSLASAIYEVTQNVTVPTIADGGIRNTGHMIKALACGASTVMLGSMLAATQESPGLQSQRNGVPVKQYRGMGSLEAMKARSGHRYLVDDKKRPQVAQGVAGFVKLQGTVEELVPEWVQAMKQGFQDLGTLSIAALRAQMYSGSLRFEKRSWGSLQESRVHMLS
jgi:IMP dehydrogenase